MTQTALAPLDDNFTFKVATEPSELEQVHRLNYRTFVEEIPQHAPNGNGLLVDKFDRENTYFICRRNDRVVGMLAIRSKRPFSLDSKVENLDRYLPAGYRFCEVRLLAVEPEHRTGIVLRGLLKTMNDFSLANGLDAAVISGAVSQSKLYRHMGFVPFGPQVGTADAPYQPMYITRESWASVEHSGVFSMIKHGVSTAPSTNGAAHNVENFLPGPVAVHADVWAAFVRPPVSHRHPDFASDLKTTQTLLSRLVHAKHVQLLVGSGTLANDAVAAQLRLLDKPGVVLTNGEFGDRLVDHANRMGLAHTVVGAEWGDTLDLDAVEAAIANVPAGGWCWMVHCETSSGILNPMTSVRDIAAKRSIHFAVDCVSSIGTVPIDLTGVYLATGVSGKALAGLPGISMVFHHHAITPSSRLPRYLDVGYYAEKGGVPFTHSSNLLAALRVATEHTVSRAPFGDLAELAVWLRARLRDVGFTVVSPEAHASPGIVSLAISGDGNGSRFGDRMADAGFELSYRSEYLRNRDWVQIALMSDCSRERLEKLLAVLVAEYQAFAQPV